MVRCTSREGGALIDVRSRGNSNGSFHGKGVGLGEGVEFRSAMKRIDLGHARVVTVVEVGRMGAGASMHAKGIEQGP